jgi:type II secretory pathway component PulK
MSTTPILLASAGATRATRAPRGIALIITMFVLFFLTALAVSYSFSIQVEMMLARNVLNDVQAHYCAKAGIYRALAELKEQQRSGAFGYPNPTVPEDAELIERYQEIFNRVPIVAGETTVGEYTVKFKDNFGQTGLGPMDEDSLINLSRLAQKGDRKTLERLLQVGTDNKCAIEIITDCLIDYCDGDNMRQPNGAEDEDYESLDPPLTLRNGPMRDVNDIYNVLNVLHSKYAGEVDDTFWFGEDLNQNGVLDPNEDDGNRTMPLDDADGVLDRGMRDYVTVDSDSDSVNPNTASPEILQIMMPEQYEELLQQRAHQRVAGNSSTFRIRSYGKANGYVHVMEWVVRLGGRDGYPSILRMYSL